jgi:excisionase family DNA binding protein
VAGASLAAVQRILRHSDPRITMGTYGHLTPDYLKSEISRLVFTEPSADPTVATAQAVANGSPLVTPVLQGPSESHRDSSTGSDEGEAFPVFTAQRDIGFEPTTFSLGSNNGALVAGGTTLQAGEKITNRPDAVLHELPRIAPVRSPFATRLLPDSRTAPERLAVLRGGRDGLLSVREAAEQLGLCTATVYGLCADKALPHVRILNAIRIAPADLAAFVAARRVGPMEE